jgi:hypothetical protein
MLAFGGVGHHHSAAQEVIASVQTITAQIGAGDQPRPPAEAGSGFSVRSGRSSCSGPRSAVNSPINATALAAY